MATMDDIAKRLGISKGTVSKAFSGAGDISEAMRRAVLETAVELGHGFLAFGAQVAPAQQLPDPVADVGKTQIGDGVDLLF